MSYKALQYMDRDAGNSAHIVLLRLILCHALRRSFSLSALLQSTYVFVRKLAIPQQEWIVTESVAVVGRALQI